MIIVLISFLVLTACTKKNDPAPIHLAVILKSEPADFWKSVRHGAEEAASEFGVNVNFDFPSTWEVREDEQAIFMQQAIEEKADGIVLAPNDYEGLVSLVKIAHDRNIPVITIDSRVNSKYTASHVSTDNYKSAYLAVQEMYKNGLRGSVAIVTVDSKDSSYQSRMDGFIEGIKEYPELEVGEVVKTNGEKKNVIESVKSLVTRNDNLSGIFGVCESCTVGSALALKDTDKKESVKVIGFDSSQDEIRLLEEGVLDSLVVQNPFAMGYLSVKAAFDKAKGNKVDNSIYLQAVIVTKDNIDLPEHQKLLYPFNY